MKPDLTAEQLQMLAFLQEYAALVRKHNVVVEGYDEGPFLKTLPDKYSEGGLEEQIEEHLRGLEEDASYVPPPVEERKRVLRTYGPP